jgi:pectate lyase
MGATRLLRPGKKVCNDDEVGLQSVNQPEGSKIHIQTDWMLMKSLVIIFIGLLTCVVLGTDAYGQPASGTWPLTSVTTVTATSSGNVLAQNESFGSMVINNYSGPSASQRVDIVGHNWPAETAQNEGRYIQFAVLPNSGFDFSVSSVSLLLGADGGGNMKANIWYSTDPTFTTRTQLNSSVLALGNGSLASLSYSPTVLVHDGQTIYLRIYPWYTTGASGKYVCPQNVVISGTASTAGAAITPSANSLTGFAQTVGVPSATQSYTVSGNGLTTNVIVTPPVGFEISTDAGSTWGNNSSPLSLPVSGGGIVGQPLTIAVRLNASSGGSYSGNISHVSTGVTIANVALSGFALAPEPTMQSGISFGTVTGSSIVVDFSGGNGSNRILVARTGAAVTWAPSDGNAVVGVNSNFTSATDQGSGNKVVYDGTGGTITVTGLTQNTTHHFAVYEYNVGAGNSQNYNTASPGTGNQTTLAVPTIVVTPPSLAFGGVEINTTSIERTYSLSGTTLTPSSGNITVTAPTGYQVSSTSGSGFASSVDIPYSGGVLTVTTVFVVFIPTSIASYPGNITNSGGGATTENVTVSGTGIGPAQQNVLEAENGILSSAYVSSQYSGYSGVGYVDIANKTGAFLEIDFRRATAATDTVRVYYALGASSRVYDVTLNGSLIGSPSFTGTGSWTTWSSMVIMVPMQAGVNRLKFTATTNTSPNANLDRIYVGGQAATPVYKLILLKSGSGTVSAAPASADSFYDAGTPVTLTATPAGGSSFYRWSGTDQSSSNPYIITMSSNQTEVGVMPANPGFGAFPYESTPKGFAAVGAFAYPNGTTGGTGPGSQTVYVTSSDDLGNLMLRRVDANHTLDFPPLTVYVIGTLTTGTVVTDMCDVKDVYDISIIGVGVDATLSGFGLNVVRAKNIIVRNLKIQNSPVDGITVQADDVDGTGNHLWFDHNTITNCYDGALDVTHTASYVTLSWNHFYNHNKLCLMGHSDSQTSDVTMKVTYHHNYFDSTEQRHPRVRYGKAHVYNNYYRKIGLYGVSSNDGADVLVEGNYFQNVPLPTDTSRDGSIPGDVVERNNIFVNCGAPQTRGTAFDPSVYYGYSVDDPATLPVMVSSFSGSGKWDFSSSGSSTPMPPGIPTLMAPSNGSTDLPLSPTLRWRTNFNTTSYRIQLSSDSTFASSVFIDSTLTDTSCVASGLSNSTTYYWRVKGINAVGAGAFSLPWRFRTVAPPAAAVSVSPATLNFGNRMVNSSTTDTVNVKSVGSLTLRIDSVRAFNGEFFAAPTSSVILPIGDSLQVSVTFSPTSAGAQSGYVVVYSDAATSPDSAHLLGVGVQSGFSGTPNPLNFGNVAVGNSRVDTITVTNPGTGTLTLDSVRCSGGEFSANPSGSGTIVPGNSAKFAVTFIPTSPGLQHGNVMFYGNMPQSLDSVEVTGTGVNSTVSVNVSIAAGWNMISNPMTDAIPGDSVRQLFPTSVNPYGFEFVPGSGYQQRYTMQNGKGYWGKFPGPTINEITGTERTTDSISVVSGWNMVGSISSALDTSTIVSIPSGLRSSSWFGYSAGYIPVNQLAPGKGHWVKTNGGGVFVLRTAPLFDKSEVRRKDPLTTLNSLTITNSRGQSQTLYFGADGNEEILLAMYDMPPAPPLGAFDARFSTAEGGSMVRTHTLNVSDVLEFPVTVQSDAYPLTVTWDASKETASYELTDGLGGQVFGAMEMVGEGSTKISDSRLAKFTVRLVGDGRLPKAFALEQNYPNPFNPTTRIKYALPVDSWMTMEIYNVLGQRVRTLVSEIVVAGYHIAEWNGTGSEGQQLGSGTYFLKLSATGVDGKRFNEVRKLLMLK